MPMTLISRQTLTGTAASVTFNNIPQTFQTLKLVVSARSDYANSDNGYVKPNTGTSLSERLLYGGGASATSGTYSLGLSYVVNGSGATASTFSNGEIVFPNYSGSVNKAFSSDSVSENNGTTALQMMTANLWSNTSAITMLVCTPPSGNFVSGSTFSLYGIA